MNRRRERDSQEISVRWIIITLLFFATVLNQLDRQTLSILATTIQLDLGISDLGYARIVQMFLIAYTIGFLVTGRLADAIGTRFAFAIFIGWWSIANTFSGFVRTATELGATRFMLGLGEAGAYTVAPKAVGEWFPPKERALAVGIYTSGSMLGAVIAPPAIGFLALTYGWRAAFVVTGVLGLVWLVPWLFIYRSRKAPYAKPPIPVEAAQPNATVAQKLAAEGANWKAILKRKEVWMLFMGRLLTDPVWYFYLFWFPKYLEDDRGLVLLQVAQIGWIVYLAADIGSIVGGLASGRLISKGRTPIASRIRVMSFVALLAPLGGLVALQPDLWITLVLASIVAFVHLMWLTNITSVVIDLIPPRQVATAIGFIGAGSGLGGIMSTEIIGRLVTSYSFELVFLCLALLHPLGWLAVRGVRNASGHDAPGAAAPVPAA